MASRAKEPKEPKPVLKPRPFATKEARAKLFGKSLAPVAGSGRPASPFGSPDHDLPSNHCSQGKYGKRVERRPSFVPSVLSARATDRPPLFRA